MTDYYFVGQPFRTDLVVRDAPVPPATVGALVDPTTAVLTFLYPNGSTVAGPAAVRDSLGLYHASVDLPGAGKYRRIWTTTGPGKGVSVGEVVMVDPSAQMIVSLSSVKRQLNIDETNTTFDAELTDFIAALPEVIEQLAGPVLSTQYTETLPGGGPVLIVRHPPIASMVSMTSGSALVVADYQVEKAAGLIRYPESLYLPNIFPYPVTVVYNSGYTSTPGAVDLGARIIIEHWWESQRAKAAGGRADRRDSGDTIDVPGLGFAIPRYAVELLQPFNPGTGLH